MGFQPSQFVTALRKRLSWFGYRRLVLDCPYCREQTLLRVLGLLHVQFQTVERWEGLQAPYSKELGLYQPHRRRDDAFHESETNHFKTA